MKRRFRPARFIVSILIILGAAVGGFYAYLIFTYGPDGGDLDNQMARAKSLGLPLLASDMRTTVPRDQNAAPLYQQLFPRIDRISKLINQTSIATQDPLDVRITNALATDGKLITDAVAASSLPHCSFEKDYAAEDKNAFPEISRLKSLVKYLCFEAETASRHNVAQTLTLLKAANQIERHLSEEPALLDFLDAVAAETMIHRSVEKIANTNREDKSAIAQLLTFAQHLGPLPDLRHALRGEVYFNQRGYEGIETLKDFNDVVAPLMQTGQSNLGILSNVPFPQRVRNSWKAKYLRLMNDMFAQFSQDDDWKRIYDVLLQTDRKIVSDRTTANRLNMVMLPVYCQNADALGKLQAERNLTVTMLRLIQDGAPQKNVHLALSSAASNDPFSSGKLRFLGRENGFKLYSVGIDQKDNGGAKPEFGKSNDMVREVG